jgi:hypothetical protein
MKNALIFNKLEYSTMKNLTEVYIFSLMYKLSFERIDQLTNRYWEIYFEEVKLNPYQLQFSLILTFSFSK